MQQSKKVKMQAATQCCNVAKQQWLALWPVPLYLTDPALHGRGESLGLIYTPMMADEEDGEAYFIIH